MDQVEMSFKRFLIWSCSGPPVCWCGTIFAIFKGGIKGTFMWNFMEFGQVLQFNYISYLELCQPLCSVDWNHMCDIRKRHHEEQPCEIILNLDQWFRRKCHFKVFLIWSSGSLFVQRSETICAISVEGIKRNNSEKLFWIWVSGSGGDVF